MIDRNADLAQRLSEYLDTMSPPRNIAGNARAMQSEVDDLLRQVLASAPSQGWGAWWDKLRWELKSTSTTRAWPTVREFADASISVVKQDYRPAGSQQAQAWSPDPMRINAARMNANEPVGEDWLYGRLAVEMIRSGLVDADTLRRYRSIWYFGMKDIYGEDAAKRREADAIAAHTAAEALGPLPDEAARATMIREERRAQDTLRHTARGFPDAPATPPDHMRPTAPADEGWAA